MIFFTRGACGHFGEYFAIKTSVSVRKAFRRLRANKEVPNKTSLFSLAEKKCQETGSVLRPETCFSVSS
jgi:hypothetical protein